MYKCSVCGYVYSESVEDEKFSELSGEWKCPVCYADKSEFSQA